MKFYVVGKQAKGKEKKKSCCAMPAGETTSGERVPCCLEEHLQRAALKEQR